MKTFKNEFRFFLKKVIEKENFSFARFSDGELAILKNERLVLAPDHYVVGNKTGVCQYSQEDQKEFEPHKHQFFRQRLIEAFQCKEPGYYKGISCRCCVGDEDFQWQLDLHGGEDHSLSWSNIFINANYPLFVEEMLPALQQRDIVLICNEHATLDKLPFTPMGVFTVGNNCIVNDYNLIDKIKRYIDEKDLKDVIFLFSASSLSNFLAHQLWLYNNNNTYIDIGTTLAPHMQLPGWTHNRGYLLGYWVDRVQGTHYDVHDHLKRECIW